MLSFDERRNPAHHDPARHDAAAAAGPPEAAPIRVQDTAELIATVPALIGYHPRESLLLIATGGPAGRRIGLVLRVDLPPSEQAEPVVQDAVGCLLVDRPAGAAVIVLGAGADPAGHPPHAALVDLVAAALRAHDVEPHTVVWAESTASGAAWACYGRCRCSGRLPDPSSTACAAAAVAGGQVIHADRDSLERLVAPADPDRVRRREQLLIARLDDTAARPAAVAVDAAAGLAAVDAAIAAAGRGRLQLDDATALELACALADTDIRDAALLRNVGPDAAAAEQLWTALTRELPDPEAAEPAALLAVSALLRGDGALANVALDRAEGAWPGHRLTRLLRRAADSAVRPAQLRAWLSGEPTGSPPAAPGPAR